MQELVDTITTEWTVSSLRAIDEPDRVDEPFGRR
jgi:hypothetical protein